jgi:ribosomal-protein-alanine N-acetyltransferase
VLDPSGAGATIRWMIAPDLDRVAQIEAASFTAPWGREGFAAELQVRTTIGRVLLPLEHGCETEPIGYLVFSIRETYVEVLNLATAPEARRLGVGRALLADLRRRVPKKRGRIVLGVTEGNLAAQLFLRACGFTCREIHGSPHPEIETQYLFAWDLPAEAQPDALFPVGRIAS